MSAIPKNAAPAVISGLFKYLEKALKQLRD
jgi:hypothetical protein